jgi:hypothetical protein
MSHEQYNPYICNFDLEERKARTMSIAGLEYSIRDCQDAIKGVNPNKYYDQISVYRQEIIRRNRKP